MKKWQFFAMIISYLLLIAVSLITTFFIARMNPYSSDSRYDYYEGFISGALIKISSFKVELAPVKNLTVAKQEQRLRNGHFRIVGGNDNIKPNKSIYTFFVSGPRDFSGLSFEEQKAKAKHIVQKVIKSKADAFVYTSNQDRFFSTTEGKQLVKLLKDAKIIRAVVFDGGHHIKSLRSKPDLLLTPVMFDNNGSLVIAHGFIRDAIVFEEFKNVIKNSTIDSSIVTFPRFLPAKNTIALGLIARKALIVIDNKKRARGSKSYKFFYFKPVEKVTMPKGGFNVIGLNFGSGTFPSLQSPPVKKFKKIKAFFEKDKNNKVISLPYSAWDIFKSRL